MPKTPLNRCSLFPVPCSLLPAPCSLFQQLILVLSDYLSIKSAPYFE
ncbi:hypothetical protein [Moorena sp. SIO3H5]|nr:hypothetical protein [Moorena sp. SIO3H5]NEO71249.1 hypothetical protein [Moorena sp. SIO3H5]